MKTRTTLAFSLMAFLAVTQMAMAQGTLPAPTIFNFQGRVYESGLPANNLYDFQFRLFDAQSGGVATGPTISVTIVGVTNGYFNVTLDFGPSAFNGAPRWLDIQQRLSGVGAYAPLAGRMPVLSTPYSTYAFAAGTAAMATAVSPGGIDALALAPGSVTSLAIADGSICTADLCPSLLDGTFWRLGGNAGTDPEVNYVGTKDNVELTIAVDQQPVMRFIPDHAVRDNDLSLPDPPVEPSESPNIRGGFRDNFLHPDNKGATLAGGGSRYDHSFHSSVNLSGRNVIDRLSDYSFLGSGSANYLSGPHNFIGGGHYNRITNGNYCVIGGGAENLIMPPVDAGAIVAGVRNSLLGSLNTNFPSGDVAFIGAGHDNTITNFAAFIGAGGFNFASGAYSVITGGTNNRALGENTVVAGGGNNSAVARQSAVGGGKGNVAGSRASVIAGGELNFVGPTNDFATILGGAGNTNIGPLATVLNGAGVLADKFGQVAFGTRFATNGDAQASFFHLRGTTPGATTGDLSLNGSGARLTLSRHSGWAFRALVIGKALNFQAAAAFEVRGMILNMDGATTVVATTTPLGSFANLGGFNAVAVADDPTDSLILRVTSPVNTTVRWSAQVETAEVNAP